MPALVVIELEESTGSEWYPNFLALAAHGRFSAAAVVQAGRHSRQKLSSSVQVGFTQGVLELVACCK